MTNEIIHEHLPYGTISFQELLQLRRFIEHKLLTDPRTSWHMNPKDPAWQAVCHYYACIIHAYTEFERRYRDLEVAADLITSGALILYFSYPSVWVWDNLEESLSPSLAFAAIADSVHSFGHPRKGGSGRLPLTAFTAHSALKPGPILQVSQHLNHLNVYCEPVFTLDDSKFISLLHPVGIGELNLTILEQRLWRRWMGDSLLGIGLRDVLLPDGGRIEATSMMAKLLAKYCCSLEHIYLVLTAVAGGLWDPNLAGPALAELAEMEHRSPKMLEAFIKALPEESLRLLPPKLLSYRW
jgi:hypothetical protein